MQLKNLRLVSKVWLLIAIMVLPLLAAGLWMTSYLLHIEKEGQEHVAAFEQRKLLVQGLRSNVELNASNFLALNMAPESERTFFEQRFQRTAQQAEDLTQQTENVLTTSEGKALFGNVQKARQGLYQAITALKNARAAGESLMPIINDVMLPAIASYQGELDKLVQWQDKLLAASQVEYQQKRGQATWLGAAVLLVALMGGMVITTWLVREITQPLQEAVTLADYIERGDLTHQIQTDRQDEMGRLLSSLGAMAVRLRDVVGQVRSGVHAVSSASSEIATGSQELSSRTEHTAANLQETAASMEQLTSTLSQSADTARQANQLAVTAVHAAERGGVVVQEVVSSMQKINTASRKINDIIGVIDGIAFQTNILALNAAVEAARAGEQGRGFAVVAGEVRALAQRSAEAAKEIKHLISDSVNSVDEGSQQVDQAGHTMQEIVDSVRRVTDLIGEITASSDEQRDGIGQVNQAVSNLDQMTQQNASLVEESSAAALAMNEQAQRLAQVVAVFNVGHAAAAAPQPMQAQRHVRPAVASVQAPALRQSAAAAAAEKLQKSQATAKPHTAAASAPAQQLLKPTSGSLKNTSVQSEDDWETF